MPENRTAARSREAAPPHVAWVVAIAAAALVFDGYDLVIYGTVVPSCSAIPASLAP